MHKEDNNQQVTINSDYQWHYHINPLWRLNMPKKYTKVAVQDANVHLQAISRLVYLRILEMTQQVENSFLILQQLL